MRRELGGYDWYRPAISSWGYTSPLALGECEVERGIECGEELEELDATEKLSTGCVPLDLVEELR